MAMTRRSFLKRLGIGAGAFVTSAALAKEAEALYGVSGEIDYERALWLPGTKSIVDLGAQPILIPDDATVSKVLADHGKLGLPRFKIETRGAAVGESSIWYDAYWNAVTGSLSRGVRVHQMTREELAAHSADLAAVSNQRGRMRWIDGALLAAMPERYAEVRRDGGWPTMAMADGLSLPGEFTEFENGRIMREVKVGCVKKEDA